MERSMPASSKIGNDESQSCRTLCQERLGAQASLGFPSLPKAIDVEHWIVPDSTNT